MVAVTLVAGPRPLARSQVGAGTELGRAAVASGLLEGKGELEQGRLAVGAGEEGDAHGQTPDKAGGHGNAGVTGDGRWGGVAADQVIAGDVVHQLSLIHISEPTR